MYQPPKWTLNNSAITNRTCKLTADNKRCKLSIPLCTLKDAGEYKCTFLPSKGNAPEAATASFSVIVSEPKKVVPEVKLKEVISPILKIKTAKIEIDEYNEAKLELEVLAKLEEDPKWYFDKKLLTKSDNIKMIYSDDEKAAILIINKIEKVQEGTYECVVTNPRNGLEENIEVIVKVVKKQSTGFLDCDIEEIDLKCGEILKLNMNAVGIEESILKSGCWYLNSKIFDLVKYKGEFNVSKDLITLYIPDVTKDIQGTLQFKIDKLKDLCSPEIEIKIRDVEKKDTKKVIEATCEINFMKDLYTVKEGDDVILIVSVKCLSTNYSVSWYFNSQILEMGSDIYTDIKENGKLAELIIKKCTKNKAGSYQCVIENKDGHASKTETKLQVNDKIIKKYIKLHEGERICLNVLAEKTSDDCQILWKKNDVLIDNLSDFKKIKENDKFILVKEISTLEDSGRYLFRSILNNDILQELEFFVTVESVSDPKVVDKIHLICDETEILAKEGEPLIISVEVDKWEGAKVQWFLNGDVFDESYELDSQFIDLYVDSPKPNKHKGIYKCYVKNNFNEEAFVLIDVRFIEDKKMMKDDIELLSCTVEEVDLVEGNQLQLSIESKENTESVKKLSWYKDNSIIDEKKDSRFSLIIKPFNYNLILNNVTLSDSGMYCLKVDENSMEIAVRVRKKPSETKTGTILKSLAIPKTKLDMKDIELENEPQSVKFEFEIEPCGPTKAVWYFENDEIEADNSEFIQWSCDTYFALTIPMACEKHCGKYTIKVTNEMGYVKNDARLSLLLKRKIVTMAQQAPEYIEESCCIAPMFTKKLKSLDLLSGEIIRLNCRVMSEPEPKILWTKDGESLDPKNSNRKMKIVNNFPNYELTIMDATIKDAGHYSCLASNFLGYDTSDVIVSIDGKDMDESDDQDPSEIQRALAHQINSPILQIISSNDNEILLSWTPVSTKDESKVTYTIDKQKFNKSNQWKTIKKDLTDISCSLSTGDLSPTESHQLRCVAITDFGSESVSNSVAIEIRTKAPTIPITKPTINIKDASCTTISWQRGKCNGLTAEESFGKILYCLEMKDNPKSSWQIVSNEIIKNEYEMSLEPGVSYMFRVSAFNANGTSQPTPSVITRIDRLKLVPDFSIEAPWLHMQGQPCLKWQAASVPEYCDSCVSGIVPEYKVEYRSGRLSPWKVYEDNIAQCQVFLTPDIVHSAQELRVSCRNKFGMNGPTKSYRLQNNMGGKNDQDPSNLSKIPKIINMETLKKAEIESISSTGLCLKWDKWSEETNHRYIIQKKGTYISEWTSIDPVVFGEDCFLDIKISENYSRELRILAVEDEGNSLYHGYNTLLIPSKEELVPTNPQDLKINAKINIHEISWSICTNHKLVDSQIFYTIQYKVANNGWITASDHLQNNSFTNERISDISYIIYRVSAKNDFGTSEFSDEVQVHTPLNVLANEQIVKSLRYFVVDYGTIEVKWQLCDVIFDNGLSVEDFSFNVEKKLSTDLKNWVVVGSCAGRNSILVDSVFDDENMFRVQPFLEGEKLTPSRLFRIYLSKELLVPDMSFTKPEIITDSIRDYFIEWIEPSIESGFSPEGLEICSVSVMQTGLRYDLQYYISDTGTTRKIRTKDNKYSQWMVIKENIQDNSYFWQNPDPTQEYVFRVVPRNQFGEGQPSRIVKLRPQITIPDFSFVRLNIEDQNLGTKSAESDIILSWASPRINPERYTPYSVDIQYRPKGSVSDEDWITLKSNVKKTRISINELDPKSDYEIRIVPVTEFGLGKPSLIARKQKRHDPDIMLGSRSAEQALTEQSSAKNEVFVSLSHDVELKFNKISNIEKDNLIWIKNEKPLLFQDEKVKLLTKDKDVTCLLINNVKEDDIGTYSVHLENNDLVQSIQLIKSDAPTFLNPPLNRSVNLHENVHITFKIDAQPPPTIIWRKNFKKIYSSYRTNITEDKENKRYSLRISKCILSDNGEYSVRAENVMGSVEVKFNLRIDAQPDVKSIQMNEGDINDRYYVIKQISRGTYSTCQLIVEKSSHGEFVGKVFGINNIGIGKMEFQSMKDIRQRNIVELFYAVLNSTESLILIYEKLEGSLLVDYISNLNHWNEQQANLIIYQLVQAVSHLHSLGIGHFDIQPCNIMITGKLLDTVKLFGFSNATKEDDLETRRHIFIASPFSAPEHLRGEPITLKCDVWSIGILGLIFLYGNLHVNLHNGSQLMNEYKGLLSANACDFIAGCLEISSLNRLSSLEAMRHEWFTSTIIDYNASLDHLKDDIVKLMTYPEEMVLNFSPDIMRIIEDSLIVLKPKLTVDSIPSSPSISQLSSRASSVSRDGINYERGDQIDEPCLEASVTYGNIKENFQSVDEKYVPNSAKELLFTVPLKDQTFKPTTFGASTNLVNLTCQLALSASDAISISWYKNQELLTDNSKIKLEVLSGGFLSCTIQALEESDAGIYRCIARSRSLRAETSARLLVGDIPPQPGQPSVLFVNENDVLLKWKPNLAATDDIIYRVDLKEINTSNEKVNWKIIGYTVDNRYLMENFSDSPCVARIVAKNKYGSSSYSVASSAFQNITNKDISSRIHHKLNKEWICSTRQSKDSNSLHDLIKDISPNDITLDIIKEYYTTRGNGSSIVNILTLLKPNGNYPEQVVQRNMSISEKCPAMDLCLRIKYYHFPIVYGAINDLSTGLCYTIEEYVPGGDLISVLLARSSYSEFTVVTILRQLIETVQFLHSNNILHANINPSNILIARRTNQLYDIKLVGLHHCETIGVSADSASVSHKVLHMMSTFQAPEYRYEGATKNETDIWSIGTLAYLLLTTKLPTIEDVCTESDVVCPNKNRNSLHLPTMHTHFRTPDLALLSKFSKGSRKFVYNTLKKNPSERGNADYWLAHSWFRQDMSVIAEMQMKEISAGPLVDFVASSF